MTSLSSVVVVGAGLAGLRACESLRRRGFDGRLRLVGAEEHLPYDRPPLSKQFLAGVWGLERCTLKQAPSLEALAIELHLGKRAESLELSARTVHLERRLGPFLRRACRRHRSNGVPDQDLERETARVQPENVRGRDRPAGCDLQARRPSRDRGRRLCRP